MTTSCFGTEGTEAVFAQEEACKAVQEEALEVCGKEEAAEENGTELHDAASETTIALLAASIGGVEGSDAAGCLFWLHPNNKQQAAAASVRQIGFFIMIEIFLSDMSAYFDKDIGLAGVFNFTCVYAFRYQTVKFAKL